MTEQEMVSFLEAYIIKKKNTRVRINLPNTPKQHLLLVKAFNYAKENY
tara:strand:- start:828 stop:971 length:144 start_codon:yes stop_codon:yes gene_type:complete